MRINTILSILILSITFSVAHATDEKPFIEAYASIDSMLNADKEVSFKQAVFTVENAYLDNNLNYEQFDKEIKNLVAFVNVVKDNTTITYHEKDIENVMTNAAIFRVMTDTIPIFLNSGAFTESLPFLYDFDDMWGQKDWASMFVIKLLQTRKGNCHSMPYLYRILSEEMKATSYLSFAPNHIYIKNYSNQTGWYNTELTSATFPVDAWLMASGYVHLDAIKNGLYMDTLSTKQSVAYCLLDLAHGYQRKIGKDNSDFVIKCCNRVLEIIPNNVNALLTKAQAQSYILKQSMQIQGVNEISQIRTDDVLGKTLTEMESTYAKLHQLGYRRMPQEMYYQWLGLLENDPEKYLNKNLIINFKNQ